ncbi:MAG: hypothetical protein ACQKBT_03250, partial [Puniceicoccales bacterium]
GAAEAMEARATNDAAARVEILFMMMFSNGFPVDQILQSWCSKRVLSVVSNLLITKSTHNPQ